MGETERSLNKPILIIIIVAIVAILIIATVDFSEDGGSEDVVPKISIPEGKYRIGDPITFDASGSVGDIVEWSWSFGDGFLSTGKVIQRNFDVSDMHTVKLTVTDKDDNEYSTSSSVSVYNNDFHRTLSGTSASAGYFYSVDNNVLDFEIKSGPSESIIWVNWTITGNPAGNAFVVLTGQTSDGESDETLYVEYFIFDSQQTVISQTFTGLESDYQDFSAEVNISEGRIITQIEVTILY